MPLTNKVVKKVRAPRKRRLGPDPRGSLRNKYKGLQSQYQRGEIPARGTKRFIDGRMADEIPARGGRTKKETLKKREAKGSAASEPSIPESGSTSAAQVNGIAPEAQRYPTTRVKPEDFQPPQQPVFVVHHTAELSDGRKIEFCEIPDHIVNKKGFTYVHATADPNFPHSIFYRHSETEPHNARISFQDMASLVYTDKTGLHVTTDAGWRGAKSNICIKSGRLYYEVKITKGIPKEYPEGYDRDAASAHVRMGFSRREAPVDKPVGHDAYSYGFKDLGGQKIHISRPKLCFADHEHMYEGDVIGLEIYLPSEQLHKKIVEGSYNPAVDLEDDYSIPKEVTSDVIRDRIPITFKNGPYFEYLNYEVDKDLEDYRNPNKSVGPTPADIPRPTHPTPSMRTLPFSGIKIYKNGVLMDEAFKDLLAFMPPASKAPTALPGRENLDDGALGYYPAVSVFRGGAVELNFGPDFWYPPPASEGMDEEVDMIGAEQSSPAKMLALKPASDRYAEQVAEDTVYDIIDEMDHLHRNDGGQERTQKAMADDVLNRSVPGTVGMKEAKELVQDDDQ